MKCIENDIEKIRNITNINLYLETLYSLKEKYLIVLCFGNVTGNNMSSEIIQGIHALGFTAFKNDVLKMYVGVSNKGEILCNDGGEVSGTAITFSPKSTEIGIDLSVSSISPGNRSEIIINNVNYSADICGLNFVIFDLESRHLIDSIGFDFRCKDQLLVRKPNFDEELMSRLYIPEKYKKKWYDYASKNFFSERIPNVQVVENAILLPIKYSGNRVMGGAVDSNFKFLAGHTSSPEEGSTGYIHDGYTVKENDISYSDETVVFGGIMLNHPGHMLVECIAQRLWWYLKNPDSALKCAVISSWGDPSRQFVKDFLDIFGLPQEQIIWIDKPTKFKKLIIPEQSSNMAGLCVPIDFTEETKMVFEHIKEKVTPKNKAKIYFTKCKVGKKNIVGEEYFINFYKNKGFEILNPEDLTLRQKIGYMISADEFVAQAGTNCHYAVFCKPSVKLTILSRTNDAPLSAQYFLNEIAGIKEHLYCVDVSGNFLHKDMVWGINLMCVTNEFKKYVNFIYNEQIPVTAEESLKENLFDYLRTIPEFYSNNRFFNAIKNQKMLTVLQNMSEVFLGKDFDTSKLDLTTNEDILRNRVNQLTADLDKSKKRVSDLESTDVYKAAKLLEATNGRLEKQIAELQSALHNMRDLQTEIDKLTIRNSELTSQNIDLINQKHELEKSLIQVNHSVEIISKDFERSQGQVNELSSQLTAMRSEENALISDRTELQKQIVDFEQSRSWRITKPLRSIAWFFRRLFGKSK